MNPSDPRPTLAWPRRRFLRAVTATALALPVAGLARSERSAAVRTDRDGMLRVRDRREFILGLYHPPKLPDGLEQARGAGFDLVHRSPDPAEFDRLRALGLSGWTTLGSLPSDHGAAQEGALREKILKLRDHPALLFWETEDEPTFVWKEPSRVRVSPEQILATAAMIRRLDPSRPLYLNHSPTHLIPTLQAYNEASDIVATDIYPVIPRGIRELYALWPDGRQGDLRDDTIGQVGTYADKMRAVAGPRRAVFMVLQAFAWEDLRDTDRDPAMVRYPTSHELRFMAWQAVIHGANGLLWWGLASMPPSAPLWPDLRGVVRELADLRPALSEPSLRLRPTLHYRETGHSLDRGVEWIAKPWGRDTLLAAVNADGNPVDVTFENLRRYRRCEAVGATHEFRWEPGRLRARFEPFGTRLWKLS